MRTENVPCGSGVFALGHLSALLSLAAVIKAGGSLSGVLFQHANLSSVAFMEYHSLYLVHGINVVLL